MIIGCSTVLFRRYELERVLDAIRGIGYEYIETQGVGPWCQHVDIEKTDPVKFEELVKSYGFKGVTALWMPNGNIISNPVSISSAIHALKWAAAAGIPVVNTGDGHKPENISSDDAMKILDERLNIILDATKGCGVKLAFEPHGTFSLSLDGLRRIMTLGSSDRIGINYDGANIHRAGYIESSSNTSGWKNGGNKENEVAVLEGIADRVVHFHAKDLDKNNVPVALGTGEVMLEECIGILKKAGYTGVVSLETEGDTDFDETILLAQKSYAFLRRMTV
jgi:sugar phosphate isomerase/epimerase